MSENENYPEPPRTDWAKLALLSEADDPEDYRDIHGLVQDEENWRELQKQVIVPFDTFGDFPAEGPFDGAKAEDQQSNVVFRWDATAGDWIALNTGTSENPVPGTLHQEAVSTVDITSESELTRKQPYDVSEQLLFQGNQIGEWRVFGFEDVSNDWTAHQDSTLTEETVDPYRGDEAAKVTGDDSNHIKQIETTFTDSLDLTGRHPSIATRIEQPIGSDNIVRVQLWDDKGDQLTYNAKINPEQNGGQNWLRVDPSASMKSGEPDLSAINEIKVIQNQSGDTEINWDDLRFVPSKDKGHVILWFDDSIESHYSEAFPILDKYGLVGAIAVIQVGIGTGGNLTISQMREMEAAGWDMTNHTYNHEKLNELSRDEQEEEIKQGVEWLQDNGFTRASDILVYPHGRFDQNTLDLAADYSSLAFATDGPNPENGNSPWYTTTAHHIRRGVADTNLGNVDMAGVKRGIDFAGEYNQVLNLFFHDVGDDIDPADLDEICEYIAAKPDIQVTTPSNWRDGLIVQ